MSQSSPTRPRCRERAWSSPEVRGSNRVPESANCSNILTRVQQVPMVLARPMCAHSTLQGQRQTSLPYMPDSTDIDSQFVRDVWRHRREERQQPSGRTWIVSDSIHADERTTWYKRTKSD
jgi:hypothetical protein